MTALLIEGFANTHRNLAAALRLFWPTAVLLVLGMLFGPVRVSGNFKADPLGSIAILVLGLGILIYLFLILCQGAVGWHRKLLLAENPKWVSLLPNRRSLQYALPVVMFVLLMLAGLLLVMFVMGQYVLQSTTAAYEELKITGNPTIEQLEALRRALIPVTIVKFVGVVAVISALFWIAQSWLLVFPHVSVRNSQPAWGKIRHGVTPPSGLIGALLIVYFLPSFLGVLYGIGVPASVQLTPAVSVTVNIISLVLSWVCFLWGLSILSLAYRPVAADEVPHDQASDIAQA